MLHVDTFVSAANPATALALQALPALPADACLVLGTSSSGKAAVLLHAAFKHAERGHRVLLLTSAQRDLGATALLPYSVPPDHEAYDLVAIRYLQGPRELQKYLACLHVLPDDELPSCIIVDDDGDLLEGWRVAVGAQPAVSSDTRETNLIRSMGLLDSARRHLRERLNMAVALIVGVPPKSNVSLFILHRWVPLELHLTEQAGGACSLTVAASPALQLPQRLIGMVATYSVAATSLFCTSISSGPPL